MAKKKILKQGNETIYPITNELCVLDNNGTSLKSKLGDLSELNTDNKNSLVDAINDIVNLNGNVKQQIVEILTGYGVECSINDTWDTLINHIAPKASTSLFIIKNNTLNSTYSFYGVSGTSGSSWKYSTANGLYTNNSTGSSYEYVTTNQKLNFSKIKSIKITAKCTSTEHASGYKIWATSVVANALNSSSDVSQAAKQSDFVPVGNTYVTRTFDVSSWTGEYYLGITRNSYGGHTFYIKDIEIELSEATGGLGTLESLIGGGGLNIITASSLPDTVVNGQVVLIPKVETTLPIVLINKNHINSSTETEICVSTTEIANNFTFNPTLNNIKIFYYLNNAVQYSGGKNSPIDGYLGLNGIWSQFSKSGIIFYLNGTDYENISGASSSNNNSVYTGYYINTSNTGGMLNINTNVMGSTVSAYVCFKKAYDLTNYSKLKITYVKDSTYAPRFRFGFSKNSNYDKVSLVKTVSNNSSSQESVTISVDVSLLTGTYYFAITGTGSTSTRYMLNVSSIILS